jgi:hypothetical protein
MNAQNVETAPAVSRRCFACKLQAEVLAALHADRFEGGMSFEALAAKYAQPDRPLSESGLRRHFAHHVAGPAESSVSEAEATDPDGGLGSFPGVPGDELDGEVVLEASTKALAEMMESLVNQYRAAVTQHPQAAERLLGTFMKVQAALARSLKQRGEDRTRREEFRKTVPRIVRRCAAEVARSLASQMRENAKNLRQCIADLSDSTRSVDDLWNYLIRLEKEWPQQVGTAMRAAVTAALNAEETRVGE